MQAYKLRLRCCMLSLTIGIIIEIALQEYAGCGIITMVITMCINWCVSLATNGISCCIAELLSLNNNTSIILHVIDIVLQGYPGCGKFTLYMQQSLIV